MYQKSEPLIASPENRIGSAARAPAGGRLPSAPPPAARSFNLLRWFSILGFVAISMFSAAIASVLSYYMAHELLEREDILTREFVQSVALAETREARFPSDVSLAEILDPRADVVRLGVDPAVAETARSNFYNHLQLLPDVLLAHVVARDRRVLWSTNPTMIGWLNLGNGDLELAFASRFKMNVRYVGNAPATRLEEQFTRRPERLLVEHHVPLYNARGEVAAVAEIYKEPAGLWWTLRLGTILVWVCTALGAVFLYLALFWIVRRADKTLHEQSRRLVEAEALCVIGEMSAAVAHGIRNPLAAMRTSAELALDGDLDSARKNASAIILQIDRLGKWVRDLLAFSRPLEGENQKIDIVALVEECVVGFSGQMERGGVWWTFEPPAAPVPRVVGDRALANQALANVLSNAIEAMPKGGSLAVRFDLAGLPKAVKLVVADTGPGMSPADLELVFKPYYTTKRNGLGLGMALVKRIMERFGGAASVASAAGKGTQVVLTFRSA